MNNLEVVFTIAAIALSVCSMLYTWRRNVSTDIKDIWEAIGNINSDLAVVKKQNEVIWGLIEQQLAKALIRPTHIEMDALLEKVVDSKHLSEHEEERLQRMLRETVEDKQEVAGVRAMGAMILAIRLAKKRIKEEQI